jgi:hypothetical protein
METFVIVAYCSSDVARKKLKIKDNDQTNVGVAQIMTTCIVAAKYFGGNHALAQEFLYEHNYFHYRLSASQFNRRFHRIPEAFYEELIICFGNYAKMANESYEFAIDSFPIQACDNIRIQRSKLFDPKQYRGMVASKRRYFFGVRVHMIATTNHLPVEFKILPVETLFSLIVKLIPKSIHAVTANGFFKKVFCFVLAYCISKYRVTT